MYKRWQQTNLRSHFYPPFNLQGTYKNYTIVAMAVIHQTDMVVVTFSESQSPQDTSSKNRKFLPFKSRGKRKRVQVGDGDVTSQY